jgi:diadenosine tetraphosphatase ApaH/serine/threonine PP2A family protein phosphatase
VSRTLIVADIHANLPALDAVLAAAGPVDDVWNLGDTVGYGPHPVEVCERLEKLRPSVWLAGNHDLAATAVLPLELFNLTAAEAAQWNGFQLSEGWRAYLRQRPTAQIVQDVTLVHGSLRDPVWEYVLSAESAAACLDDSTTPLVLVGHSHVALSASQEVGGEVSLLAERAGAEVVLNGPRRLVNPGSVGQPRDGDPRAAFAVLERDGTGTRLTFGRAPYDIVSTQDAMRRVGLPGSLIQRLAVGR